MTCTTGPQPGRLCAGLLAALGCAQAQATAIPFKPDRADGPGAETWGGALLISLLALAALLFLARRYMPMLGRLKNGLPPAEMPAVRLLGSVRLNPQVQLTVVEFEHRKLLLAVTATSATVLERSDPVPQPGDTP